MPMDLGTLMIIAAVVAAVGSLSTQWFRDTETAHLITITGTRLQVAVCAVLIWTAAVAIGLVALVVVSMLMSSIVAIAIFFGVEAVALDICAHRTRYHRVSNPAPARVRVTALNRP